MKPERSTEIIALLQKASAMIKDEHDRGGDEEKKQLWGCYKLISAVTESLQNPSATREFRILTQTLEGVQGILEHHRYGSEQVKEYCRSFCPLLK